MNLGEGSVVVLAATPGEQSAIAAAMVGAVAEQVAGRTWLRGYVDARPVELVTGGLGAVNTAHALTRVLQGRRPAWVLQIGVGGAFPAAALSKGDLAVANTEYYGDVGVRTAAGWQPAEVLGIPLFECNGVALYNQFQADPGWTAWAVGRLRSGARPGGARLAVGPFLTVQECTGTARLAAERYARWQPICENMEGAAAAHICRLYGVPLVEIRGISNVVEDRRRESWDLPGAADRAQRAALVLLRHPDPSAAELPWNL
jgi:futalosine hydrolase